ncbi:MAG: RNA polymerase sigma factor [Patescibacteria group bacterium]
MKKPMTNEKLFISAYDEISAPLLRHIYFRVNNQQLAEDLLQETFFKTWQYIASGEKEIKSLKSFLYSVANNLVIDHWRQKPKAPVSLENENMEAENFNDETSPEKNFDRLFYKELVQNHLSELGDDYKQILLYRYVDDLTIKEISEVIRKTPNNISVMIHRALKMLKEKINHV